MDSTSRRHSPTIALDLGGTQVRAAVVVEGGELREHRREPTPHADPEPTVLVSMIDDLRGRLHQSDPDVEPDVVVGVPGVVDYVDERLRAAPNLPPGWESCLTEEWLGARTGLPVSLANDADLAAVGEAYFGAGREFSDVAFVTISTGVGAGVLLGRKLVHGRHSGAEIGHSVIDRTRIGGDKPATVELLGSGSAFGRHLSEGGYDLTAPSAVEAIAEGEADIGLLSMWEEVVQAVGLGIVNLCWFMSPQVVVVGGGLGMNADLVLPPIRRLLAEEGPPFLDIEVVSAALGDNAGLSGAGGWFEAVGRSADRPR